MCNLYRMTKMPSEVAHWFDAAEPTSGVNFGSEVYPGYPGLVMADGPKGRKTRSWLSLPGDELFACAVVWRSSDERTDQPWTGGG